LTLLFFEQDETSGGTEKENIVCGRRSVLITVNRKPFKKGGRDEKKGKVEKIFSRKHVTALQNNVWGGDTNPGCLA